MAQKGSEKRQFLRFPVVLPVDFGKADYFLSTMCSNVSQRGLFVETSQKFARGERVCLFISLPNQDDPVKMIGEVVWTTEGTTKDIEDNTVNGIGIRFVDGNPEADQLLKGFLNNDKKNKQLFVSMEENRLIL